MNGQAKTLNPSKFVQNVKAHTGTRREKLTQEKLREILHYDPVTGLFTWVESGRGRKVGSFAGTISADGYRRIMINGETYKSHRLAILYMDGYWPENEVDHINRIRDDNKYCNLREASRQCQMRNCSMRRDNKSGVKGIFWHQKNGKWRAHISILGVDKHLGYFSNFIEACYHRLAAEQCLGYQDCDILSSAKKYILGDINV